MDYEKLIATLNRKGYHGYFCKDSAAAKKLVMEQLLEGVHSIGKGGSASLRECGIWDALLEQDARTDEERIELFSTTLYNSQGKDPQIALDKGMTADAYICSTNAMTEGGTFINIDGVGNRVGAMIYGPKKVILVVGKNKIFPDYETAWDHLKNVTCPKHSLHGSGKSACAKAGRCVDCDNDNRMCCITSVQDRALPDREYHIVIVDEELGY